MAKSRSIGGIYASLSLRDKEFRDGIKRAKLSLKEIREGQRGGLVNRDRGIGGTDWAKAGEGAMAFGAGAAAAGAAFVGMNAAMKGVLETYAGYDSMVLGLKLLDGTATATAARMERLREVAKMPGLGFEQAVQGDIRLRSTGLSAEESEKAIRGFGNALAAVGGSKVDLDGVFLALGQISAKGKVSAEEINQLAERIPQIRKIMKDAFGTADTEAIQKMGVDSKEFISKIISELENLPRATGGAQNALDNYSDSWVALKTQASEFGMSMASTWIGDVTKSFDQARRHLLQLKTAMGVKTPALAGADGQTENQRYSDKAMEDTLKAAQEARNEEARAHNEGVAFWMSKEEERTALMKAESDKRSQIEAEKNKSRAEALALYNEESGIIAAQLSGNEKQVAALERQKSIREKIAELMAAGFTEAEAAGPAAAMVDARRKVGNQMEVAALPDVNDYQRRGLSLDANGGMPAQNEQVGLLKELRDIVKLAAGKREPLKW